MSVVTAASIVTVMMLVLRKVVVSVKVRGGEARVVVKVEMTGETTVVVIVVTVLLSPEAYPATTIVE